MANKPANQDLSQAFTGLLNGAALDALYESTIDATLVQFGRDVIMHLEPARNLPNLNATHYNPFTGGQDHRLDASNSFTGNKGVELTPIQVTYRAHIKHGPIVKSEQEPFSVNENEVAITTVYSSMQDIEKCVELEVDGLRFVLSYGPRPIGFATAKYIISVWRRKVDGA